MQCLGYKSDKHLTNENIHTNGTHNNNNDNTTAVLNKTAQNHGHHKRKIVQERIMSYVLKQMYISVNDENAIALKYFDLRTSAVWRFRKVNSCLRMAK
jgi:hypothetical protein